MAITIEWQGAATAAWDEEAFDQTEQLPQPQIRVGLVVGRQLSATYCNDVLMPGPRVDGDAPAVAGSVALVVRPDAGGFRPGSHADLSLQDVAFEIVRGTDTETWVVDHLELQDISVGWFAG